MSGLDGYQPTEPTAEHKDGPDPQRATGGEENDAKPAYGIPVDGPELLPVCEGRQIGAQHPDHREGDDDPAVSTILALAGAEVSATEKRCTGQHEECTQGRSGAGGEEGGKPAPPEYGEPEIGKGRHDGEGRQSGRERHRRLLVRQSPVIPETLPNDPTPTKARRRLPNCLFSRSRCTSSPAWLA